MMISECCTKEKPLLRRAQSGDPDAIELFLAGYVPLLRALAKRFFCVSLSVQDLCQAGYSCTGCFLMVCSKLPVYKYPWL